MKDIKTLPFALTTSSLALWLDTLAYLSPAVAANQLDQCLKDLDECRLEADVYLPLLINLSPTCISLALSLSALELTDSKYKLAKKSVKIAKLGIQMLKRLATAFCALADNQQLDHTETQTASYYALQLFGYCLRNCALLYEMPSRSIWKKTALLYDMAQNDGSLENKQAAKIYEFKNQTTIAGVLRRNLLFSIFTPTRYTAHEIDELFKLSNTYYAFIDLGAENIADYNFCWPLDGDEPFPVKFNHKHLPLDYVVIDTQRFVHALQLGALKTLLKPSTQAKIALNLSGYQQVFSSLSKDLPYSSELLMGFSQVCDFLQKQEKLSKIKELGYSVQQNMTLMPLEHEKKYFSAKTVDGQNSPGETVKLMRTSSKFFVIAENATLEFTADPLSLLHKANQPAMLTIIRQKIIHELTGVSQILLETIPGVYSVYEFKCHAAANHKILVVGERSAQPEAFLPVGKYGVETKILLNKGKSLYLKTCIEYNQHFCRFRVSFEA